MNLFKIIFSAILIVLVIYGCKEAEKPNYSKSTSVLKSDNENWVEYLNKKSDSLYNLYSNKAVKILNNGNVINGNKSIKDYLLANQITVKSIYSDTVTIANQKRGLEYDIGGFIDTNNEEYKHIIIWETKNSERKRVFEFASKIEESENILFEIDKRRDLWMKLCNAHNAEALINELYSPNTIYFNHKPLVIGRKGLIEDYQYMNNENYELVLNPIIVEQVSADFVFEIGQCVGSYNGKYIIIWRKSDGGTWEVFIDSNI